MTELQPQDLHPGELRWAPAYNFVVLLIEYPTLERVLQGGTGTKLMSHGLSTTVMSPVRNLTGIRSFNPLALMNHCSGSQPAPDPAQAPYVESDKHAK